MPLRDRRLFQKTIFKAAVRKGTYRAQKSERQLSVADRVRFFTRLTEGYVGSKTRRETGMRFRTQLLALVSKHPEEFAKAVAPMAKRFGEKLFTETKYFGKNLRPVADRFANVLGHSVEPFLEGVGVMLDDFFQGLGREGVERFTKGLGQNANLVGSSIVKNAGNNQLARQELIEFERLLTSMHVSGKTIKALTRA